jgi:hypothetical protein
VDTLVVRASVQPLGRSLPEVRGGALGLVAEAVPTKAGHQCRRHQGGCEGAAAPPGVIRAPVGSTAAGESEPNQPAVQQHRTLQHRQQQGMARIELLSRFK